MQTRQSRFSPCVRAAVAAAMESRRPEHRNYDHRDDEARLARQERLRDLRDRRRRVRELFHDAF